jgi:MSHA pilin protein MshD
MCTERRCAGFTLVELIVAIVIVGISIAAVASVFVVTTQHSADPMARQQAQLIAEAYLDEILLKRFWDPDTNTVCPPAEGARSDYDNVCDYHSGGPQAAADQFGNVIAGYTVQVTVVRDNLFNLNSLGNGPAGNEIRLLRVDVAVTGPNNVVAELSGYRTNYECNAPADPGCKPL